MQAWVDDATVLQTVTVGEGKPCFLVEGSSFLVKLAVGQLSLTFPYMGMALATRVWIGMSSIVLGYQNIIAEHLSPWGR